MFVGLDPRGGSAVARDLGSAADMFVGLDPRGGPAVTRDLGSAADMLGERTAQAPDIGTARAFLGPRAVAPATGVARIRKLLLRRPALLGA